MFKTSKVKVCQVEGAEAGVVIKINANKPDYASIMLEQSVIANKDGFLSNRHRVAFLTGTTDDMNMIVGTFGLAAGTEMPGNIVIKETDVPQYEGHTPKINPSTGRVVLIDGKKVFSKASYDDSGLKLDVYLTGEQTDGDVIEGFVPKVAKKLETTGSVEPVMS